MIDPPFVLTCTIAALLALGSAFALGASWGMGVALRLAERETDRG